MDISESPVEIDDCRAADAVVTELEAMIQAGNLPDNQPLPSERKLMEQFDISRTVVREAVTTLANRGLLESKPRFRPVVRKPNFNTFMETSDTIIRHMMQEDGGVSNLYQSRVFVERGLVRDAALNANKEDIASLKLALQKNQDAIGDSLMFYETDMAFHHVFYTATNNPIFSAVHKAYTAWLEPYWKRMRSLPERNELNYQAHEAIYQAILARDPDLAETALVKHLADGWEQVWETFEEDPPAASN